MKLFVLLFLLISTLFSADIYDEYKLLKDANASQVKNYFFDGEFEEIIRFDDIIFENEIFSIAVSDSLKEVSRKINSYQNGKREFYLSIIGHTEATTDNENENRIDSDTYANKIQNIFRDSFDTNSSEKLSKDYAQQVKKYLLDNNVSEQTIHLEYRKGLDRAYSDKTDEGRGLSNRVMVTLYVEKNLDIDDDGVVNSRDLCPETEKGHKVDRDGCKFNTIVLLVDNNKDHNAIVVSTEQNRRVIDEARDYTLIKSKNDFARLYKSMPDEDMKNIFKDVLEPNDVEIFTLYFDSRDFVNVDKKLNEIVEFIKNNEDSYIQIIGHTDSKGAQTYNEELAKKRAEIVALKIKESGAKYLHIQVESYGEHNLALKTPDGVDEALNRRVEVLIR